MTRKAACAILALVAIISAGVSCTSALTDTGEFSLYYPGITDIGPSTNMDLTPSWHGGTPGNFEIYSVSLDGQAVITDFFSIDPDNGVFQIRKSSYVLSALIVSTVLMPGQSAAGRVPS